MNLIKVLLGTILLLANMEVMALDSDSNQPVYIDSNTASFNDETGISIYTGDVVTVQGSLHINSDKLVVHLKKGAIEKMVFTGKPAKFRQLPGKGKDEIHGEALTGEYYPNKNQLFLREKAVVSQGNNRSSSRLIIYDSKNYLIKAGEKSSDAKRVHSVFKPKAQAKVEETEGQVEQDANKDSQ